MGKRLDYILEALGVVGEQTGQQAFDFLNGFLSKEVQTEAEKRQAKKALIIVTLGCKTREEERDKVKAKAVPVIAAYKENLAIADDIQADLEDPTKADQREALERDLTEVLEKTETMADEYEAQKLSLEEAETIVTEWIQICHDTAAHIKASEAENSAADRRLELAKLKKGRRDRKEAQEKAKADARNLGAYGLAAQAKNREAAQIEKDLAAAEFADKLMEEPEVKESASLAARRAAVTGVTNAPKSAAERLAALQKRTS